MVFTGLKERQIDLYILDLKSGLLRQLTNNIYAEMLPCWNHDGTKVILATDEISIINRLNAGPWYHNMAEINITSKEVNHLNIFSFADNLNPQYDQDDNIWFLSDRDGYRNIYKYEPRTDSIFQQTHFMTGV